MSLLQQLSGEIEALVAQTTPAVVGVEHGNGHGTGLILAQDGYLLTNSHVVSGGRGALRIRMTGDDEVSGRVVGTDSRTDLAVVRADASGLVTLPLAKGRSVNVGQLVVAIGNPYRFERSVSLGVISALDRSLPSPAGVLEGLLQTDAAINPGNSGGPLVNGKGEVVGINTAIIPYAQGIGFAIPAYTADWVASVLISKGSVTRPYLGIAARGEQLGAVESRSAGQPRAVRVLKVETSTPADQAGLRAGDLVLGVDGSIVSSVDDVQRIMVLGARAEVEFAVLRSGHRRSISVRPRAQGNARAA